MITLNISLPDDLQAFIEQQISIGSYGTASDYISHLIRQEQERSAEKPLETLLIEGLDSGDPIEATEAWWTQKRADLVGRLHSFPSWPDVF